MRRPTIIAFAICVIASLVLAPAISAVKPPSTSSTGSGTVFFPNTVAQLQDQSLTDQKDADYTALQPAYHQVTLTNLDGSGYLVGDWANIRASIGTPAYSATNQFLYHRNDDRFEPITPRTWVTRSTSTGSSGRVRYGTSETRWGISRPKRSSSRHSSSSRGTRPCRLRRQRRSRLPGRCTELRPPQR